MNKFGKPQRPETKHHVIFLGAGASATSGYPIGNTLRLRICSRQQILAAIQKEIGSDGDIQGIAIRYLDKFRRAIELFRDGGFATVDEFCKLASDKDKEHSQEMKSLMQLAFGLHNPEDRFEESDYYGFIQRLFDATDLHSLRTNVAILSYNYDFYLDFLLLRAFTLRQGLADIPNINPLWRNKLTSGFNNMEDTNWVNDTAGFNYFKLHGSIGYGLGVQEYPHGLFFRNATRDRLSRLMSEEGLRIVPPIVFPWEIFDDSGDFITEGEFVFLKSRPLQTVGQGKALYNLYKAIWEGARKAVTQATKISFVGLSAHEYMVPGLKYLFKEKTDSVQLVVANPDNTSFKDANNRLHPASLCGRVAETLERIAPEMKHIKSHSEDDGIARMKDFDNAKAGVWIPEITPRYSFKEFINTEM